MPKASASKPKIKGGSPSVIQTTPRGVAAIVRSLRKKAEICQAAVKHARRKPSDKASAELVDASESLAEETLDAETILRHAEKSGLKTQALKDAIEFAHNTLLPEGDDLESSGRNNPPTPNPKPKKTSRRVPDPTLDTVAEEGEGEEEQEAQGTDLPDEGGKSRSEARKSKSKKTSSVTSKRSEAEKDLTEAELYVQESQNKIELLMAQLETEKLALRTHKRNVGICKERVSNRSESSSSLSEEFLDNKKTEKQKQKQTRDTSPSKRSKVSEWLKKNRKDRDESPEERESVINEISQATASVLRRQMLQTQNTMGPSVLEGVKIMERRRPSEKFTGEDSKIDFEDHIAQFKKAIDIPGLPASFKLAELKEWFGGLAKINLARYLRRGDHENALEEAIARLRSEHGCQATTAEEMLEDILSGKRLEPRDAVGISTAISKLEEAYFLAVETGRDADFNRNSLFKNILTTLFPHLTIKWAAEVAKAQDRGEKRETFEDFLHFLSIQKRVATMMRKLTSETEKPEKSTKTNKKPVQKEDKDGDGFKKVENKRQKSKSAERPKPEPRECSLCLDEKHWLHDCKKFAAMEIEDRWEYVFERSICPKCMRWTHKVEDCTYVARCGSCGGGHNTRLHGAKHMSEDLKRPMEVDKKT